MPNAFLDKRRAINCYNGQHGAITLVVSLTILMLSTMVTINVTKAILMEQKISNNEARAKQAFEAAEAGMVAALAYLKNDPDVDQNTNIDPVFDTDADGTGDTNTAAIGAGSVEVTTQALSDDLTSILISAQGFSDDGSANHTITQSMATINPLPNAPANPIISKSALTITGSATVHNNEGHSTIWSGGDIDLGSNNSTKTEVPDIGAAGYPACMDVPLTCTLVTTSNKLSAGVDVIENDSSLGSLTSEEMFRSFFGTNPSVYRASQVTIDTVPSDASRDADLATHEVIWVEGDTTFNGVTVGCTTAVNGNSRCTTTNTKPSIIVVNGDATFRGNSQFYGIVYITGKVSIVGNTTVYGAMVVAGDSESTMGGSLDVWFSSSVLAGTAAAGASTGSAGSWRDF